MNEKQEQLIKKAITDYLMSRAEEGNIDVLDDEYLQGLFSRMTCLMQEKTKNR